MHDEAVTDLDDAILQLTGSDLVPDNNFAPQSRLIQSLPFVIPHTCSLTLC